MSLAQPERHVPRGEDFLLLAPAEQAYAYGIVDQMFATRTVRRGDRVAALARGEEIAPSYAHGGVREYMDRMNVAGLLVLRGGRVVLERYGLGLREETRWSTMSTVKSMTAMLVGAAIQAGAIGSVEQEVCRFLPALKGSAYEGVSVRHLLTMSSGVRWSEVYSDRASDVNRYSKSLGDRVPGGVLALMRSLPREAAPGTRFLYNTGDTYLLGCLVSAAMGKTLAEVMSQAVWAPRGMESDAFYTLESEDGQEIGGSRAGIVLRDFGRFGQFVLEGGGGVLPAGWVEEAGRIRFPLDPSQNSYGAVGYGYSWWIAADGAMVAVGFAGQSLYVNRAAGVVIVTLSCWPQPPYEGADGIDRRAERLAFNEAVLRAA